MTWTRPPARSKQYTGAAPTPRQPAVLLRVPDGKARMCVPIPKANPERDESYRRLVAALPCANCGVEGYSQAAHGPVLGRGIKANDLDCFPLCCARPGIAGCHADFDQYRLFDRWGREVMALRWAEKTREALRV